jgi:predicted ArsR family transcriptional regulator
MAAIVQCMTATAFPPGYRGIRGEVLTTLKKAQPLTAKELADRFGVTPNALRRHL